MTSGLEISDNKLLNEFKNSIIREAIFLASPILYNEIAKWSENKIQKPVEVEKSKIHF